MSSGEVKQNNYSSGGYGELGYGGQIAATKDVDIRSSTSQKTLKVDVVEGDIDPYYYGTSGYGQFGYGGRGVRIKDVPISSNTSRNVATVDSKTDVITPIRSLINITPFTGTKYGYGGYGSMPYSGYTGLLADDEPITQRIVTEARSIPVTANSSAVSDVQSTDSRNVNSIAITDIESEIVSDRILENSANILLDADIDIDSPKKETFDSDIIFSESLAASVEQNTIPDFLPTIQPDIRDRFPPEMSRDKRIVTNEKHEFVRTGDDGSSVKTVYTLDEGPFRKIISIQGIYNGQKTAVPEDGYEIKTQKSLFEDTIEFTDPDNYPDIGSTFYVTYSITPIIDRYIDAFDTDVDNIDRRLSEVRLSHFIEDAQRESLIEFGKLFGPLGRRQNRSNDAYREYLSQIVETFTGRGTKQSLKFALSNALNLERNVDPTSETVQEQITLRENFQTQSYAIQLNEWNKHNTDILIELAEIADPSGVRREKEIYYLSGNTDLSVDVNDSFSTSAIGLSSDELGRISQTIVYRL